MSDKAAGWYPDPDGANQQRYWDGDSWTEYYTPLPPVHAEVHGASTAAADYPYLVASKTGSHHDLMAAPIRIKGDRGWPTAPADGGDGQTQEFNGGGGRSRASLWALVAASALVVMLVVGVGWWAFGPDGTTPLDPDDTDTTQPTDGETVTADLSVNTPTEATVPEAGMWVGALTLDAETTVLIDAHGSGSSDDLRVTIVAAGGGDPVGGNDDRGSNLGNITGNALDPLATATLAAGQYEIQVDERNGAEVDFEISATTITPELEPGATLDIQAPEGGYWAGALTVTEGSYQLEVSGITTTENPNPDAVVVVFGDGERQYFNDDRNADDRDPRLEQHLPEGTWVVLVFDYRVRALTAEVTLTQAP